MEARGHSTTIDPYLEISANLLCWTSIHVNRIVTRLGGGLAFVDLVAFLPPAFDEESQTNGTNRLERKFCTELLLATLHSAFRIE